AAGEGAIDEAGGVGAGDADGAARGELDDVVGPVAGVGDVPDRAGEDVGGAGGRRFQADSHLLGADGEPDRGAGRGGVVVDDSKAAGRLGRGEDGVGWFQGFDLDLEQV